MSSVLQHPTTAADVERFIGSPSHGMLLVGSLGVGKTHLATYIASALLNIALEQVTSYPYFTHVAPGPSISIDQIRELQRAFVLKIPGDRTVKRVAYIESADTMTHEAQNALLKLLEEPPADSVLLLSANHEHSLLPTIRSRLQTIIVRPLTGQQMKSAFSNEEIVRIASGLPGLAVSMQSTKDHPLVKAIAQAKEILGMSVYDRLLQVNDLSRDKDATIALLQGLILICRAAMRKTNALRWHKALKATLAADSALQKNANSKLVLTNLMVQL